MAAKRAYTPEEKLKIVLEGMSGTVSVSDLCKKYYLKPARFYYWKDQLLNSAPEIFENRGRKVDEDRNEIDSDLKGIFLSPSREDAIDQFNVFKDKWSSEYPKPVYNMEKNLSILLKYYDYPEPIRQSIHSTNIVERMNKEIRRRIKIIDSLPSKESAMKMIYLRSAEINEQWSLRSLRGFYKCKDEIGEMFQKRYPL